MTKKTSTGDFGRISIFFLEGRQRPQQIGIAGYTSASRGLESVRNETLCRVYRGPTNLMSRDLDIVAAFLRLSAAFPKNPVVTRAAENQFKNRTIELICSFLPPRVFVKCPAIRKMDGRGGGDRTLSTQPPKSLNQFTREHRFGATWGQKVRHLLHCRTLRIADNLTINSQRDPRIRMTQSSLGSTEASCNRGWRNWFTVA